MTYKSVRQAIILAAGRGERLGASAPSHGPKSLLQLGGITLLEWQLEALHRVGVKHVTIVVGYGARSLMALAGELQLRLNMNVEFVHNPLWERTNTLRSLALAAPWMEGAFFVIKGDVLFGADFLWPLIYNDCEGAVAVEVKACREDQVKVTVDRDLNIQWISSGIPSDMAIGEGIGVARFGPKSGRLFAQALREAAKHGPSLESDYELAMESILTLTHLKAVSIHEPVIDIDHPEDLRRARSDVLPAILNHELQLLL